MREIPLSRGKIALVDDDMYEFLAQWKWQYFATGCGYAGRMEGNRKEGKRAIMMHRVIMNAPKGIEVDHINGNGLDCQEHNMRLVTHAQNMRNKRKRSGSTSQYKGVSPAPNGRWRAEVKLNGRHFSAGHYATEIEAAQARDKKAKELHGEFASLNFPDE